MKIIKKVLLLATILVVAFGIFGNDKSSYENQIAAAAEVDTFLTYMPITYRGQLLSSDQISVDKESNKKAYVLANDTITINILPLDYKYYFYNPEDIVLNGGIISDDDDLDYNYNKFSIHTTTIFIPVDSEEYNNEHFSYNNKTYYYHIFNNVAGGTQLNPIYYSYISIYDQKPFSESTPATLTSRNTDMLTFEETEDGIKINIIDSFTIIDSDDKNPVDFRISVLNSVYTITFLKTIVRFANAENPVVLFDTYKNFNTDVNDYMYRESDNWLQKEQTFSKIDFSFLNDNYEYLENNSLYFKINFNGFIYEFKLYSSDGYLFITYIDEVRQSQATTEAERRDAINDIASRKRVTYTTDREGNQIENVEYIRRVDAKTRFSLSFTYRGRYEIEVYDDTYKYGFNNPNYYKTSFYIKDDIVLIDTLFNNIYIIAQTIDEESNPIEYIVNGATLNHNVTTTIKNVPTISTDEINLSNIISKVIVSHVRLGVSGNNPEPVEYLPAELIEKKMIDENGDLKFSFDMDAFYKIDIVNVDETKMVSFTFTIIKQPKTAFKNYKKETPYQTEIRKFTDIIENSDPIQFNTVYGVYDSENNLTLRESQNKLGISYLNNYNISYAMEQVDIIFTPNGKHTALSINCYGVGDITVEITVNNVTSTLILNYEKRDYSVVVSDFGKYTVRIVDSMGSEKISGFKFSKKLNTSTMILIGVGSFIAVCIALFIFSVRGRVKTR